ncbi:MAG: DUF1902 domain-containing protein [Oscillospiraceae bacterium]|nr:DUF1902 domain-containing protein [Oscillospiraceae bacterium]
MKKTVRIRINWEDGVWQSEVLEKEFSVVLESGSLDALIERVKTVVQEILETDLKYTGDIEFLFQAERTDSMKARVIA